MSSIINTRLPTDEEYAALQDVHNVQGLFKSNTALVSAARVLFALHGVTDKFVLFALHKHFPVPTSNVLLQETLTLPDGTHGEVVHPVPADSPVARTAHPVAYFVSGDALQPYKYAPGPGPDLTPHARFLAQFVALVKAHGAEGRFALKLPNVSPGELMTEGEIPAFGATVLVPGAWAPRGDLVPLAEARASAVFDGDECAAGEKHAKKTNGMHAVFDGEGPTAPVYYAALEVMRRTAGQCGQEDSAFGKADEFRASPFIAA